MATVKGYVCTLSLGGSELLRHKGVEINRDKEMNDVTTKNSGGNKEVDPGLHSWETNTIEIVRDTDDSIIPTLKSAFAAGTLLDVVFVETGGGALSETGTGYLSQWHVSVPVDNCVTITMKITGSGALS